MILNDNYVKVHSYHPEFMQIIEEGLINRLSFAQSAIIQNNDGVADSNFMDDGDDNEFSII